MAKIMIMLNSLVIIMIMMMITPTPQHRDTLKTQQPNPAPHIDVFCSKKIIIFVFFVNPRKFCIWCIFRFLGNSVNCETQPQAPIGQVALSSKFGCRLPPSQHFHLFPQYDVQIIQITHWATFEFFDNFHNLTTWTILTKIWTITLLVKPSLLLSSFILFVFCIFVFF